MNTATRIATATTQGAQEAIFQIADLLAGMHSVEQRQMESSLPQSSVRYMYQARADMLADFARELQKLSVELKLEAPPSLAAITGVRAPKVVR